MKFEMTKCNQCGSEILMGLDACPSCGRQQARSGRSASLANAGLSESFRRMKIETDRAEVVAGVRQVRQPLLAVGLAVAVLFVFNWLKSAPPQTGQVGSPPPAAQVR